MKLERKEGINDLNEKHYKVDIQNISRDSVKVQIGMYKNILLAEKDMPNILLLNIDLLSDIENSSINIKKNKEEKYSIFVSKITYALAENLCVRTRSQETTCNILAN